MSGTSNDRLHFLVRVVRKEIDHLEYSTGRVFKEQFTVERARSLATDPEQAERVEAYTSRFCRLQDTVGDKLLPTWLHLVGEHTGTALDNLDRVEKLGLLNSADQWMAIRQTRNQMIHEYMESPEVLASALNTAHRYQAEIIRFSQALIKDLIQRRLVT
ncbi:MAG: hypothetical protein LAT62_13930 [Natronospirillum sp.]|uniref:hypothetical protein n=1 Tax=Natronospirillum sp. TaxID=2812955 RepID=UPI0025E740ED|nr:hypothetical protein [Natronospirillum sp.]MCH8553031.1 hypothetical protein [Natronospirillum sp.]